MPGGQIAIYTAKDSPFVKELGYLCFLGLYSLQHRGFESAGMGISDGERATCYKDLGMLNQVFSDDWRVERGKHKYALETMEGHIIIGHLGASKDPLSWKECQPSEIELDGGELILVSMCGKVVNAKNLWETLKDKGIKPKVETDSQLVGNLIKFSAKQFNYDLEMAIKWMTKRIKGAYTILILLKGKLIILKDPWSILPLAFGKLKDTYIFASETCVFDRLEAEFIRHLYPGEMIVLSEETPPLSSEYHTSGGQRGRPAWCFFEIARQSPDSLSEDNWYGHQFSQKLGDLELLSGKVLRRLQDRKGYKSREKTLLKRLPKMGYLVVPMTDSDKHLALEMASALRLPYVEGVIKNRYMRGAIPQELAAEKEYSVIPGFAQGKRVILVNIWIVRGKGAKIIIRKVKEEGKAKEIHLAVGFPQVKGPCFLPGAVPKEELIARNRSLEEIRKILGGAEEGKDYLESYIEGSFPNIVRHRGRPKQNFCLGCFGEPYPFES